jgi:hypothetical protein
LRLAAFQFLVDDPRRLIKEALKQFDQFLG